MLTFAGELAAAGALHQELKTVTEATGDSLATDPAMSLAAFWATRSRRRRRLRPPHETSCDGVKVWLSVAEWGRGT